MSSGKGGEGKGTEMDGSEEEGNGEENRVGKDETDKLVGGVWWEERV